MPTGHPSNRNRRVLLHHLLVHLQRRIMVSTIIGTLQLSLLILKVTCQKMVVILMYAPSVAGTIRVIVVMATPFILSVIRMGTSGESVQRN